MIFKTEHFEYDDDGEFKELTEANSKFYKVELKPTGQAIREFPINPNHHVEDRPIYEIKIEKNDATPYIINIIDTCKRNLQFWNNINPNVDPRGSTLMWELDHLGKRNDGIPAIFIDKITTDKYFVSKQRHSIITKITIKNSKKRPYFTNDLCNFYFNLNGSNWELNTIIPLISLRWNDLYIIDADANADVMIEYVIIHNSMIEPLIFNWIELFYNYNKYRIYGGTMAMPYLPPKETDIYGKGSSDFYYRF